MKRKEKQPPNGLTLLCVQDFESLNQNNATTTSITGTGGKLMTLAIAVITTNQPQAA